MPTTPPTHVYMLQNKVSQEFYCRSGTCTPSVWSTVHGAVNAKASSAGGPEWRIRIYDLVCGLKHLTGEARE